MGTALSKLLKKIQHSVLTLTKKLAKQSSLVWVNFTLISSLTVCAVSSKLKQTLVLPQVAYRETFRSAAKVEGKFARQSGGRGQFGHVWIEFEPNEEGKGFEFEKQDRRWCCST